jgi:hypothetical protein
MLTREIAVPGIVAPEPGAEREALFARARELIRAAAAPPSDEEEPLIRGLKHWRRFDYARKLLELARAGGAEESADRWIWRTQQHALCTYKDPDLPADHRLKRAWEILEEIGGPASADPETLGLAGSVQKQWWELTGRRRHLEESLDAYSRGFEAGIGDGYCAINAAFVLDLLAGEEAGGPPSPARAGAVRQRRERAAEIRTRVVETLEAAPGGGPVSWWRCATLAEAHFGLGAYERARGWLRRGAEAEPAGWEREATARQLARIFLLREEEEEGDRSAAWDALKELYRGSEAAVRTAFTGKVGLALSGGRGRSRRRPPTACLPRCSGRSPGYGPTWTPSTVRRRTR